MESAVLSLAYQNPDLSNHCVLFSGDEESAGLRNSEGLGKNFLASDVLQKTNGIRAETAKDGKSSLLEAENTVGLRDL